MAVSSTTYSLAEVLDVSPSDDAIESEVERISENSLLTTEQVRVSAMKQAGYSHREIASLLNQKQGAVDMRSAEVNKIWKEAQDDESSEAKQTIDFLLPT